MCMRLLCTRKRFTASSSPCVAGRGDGGGIERIKQAAAEKSLPKSMLAAINMTCLDEKILLRTFSSASTPFELVRVHALGFRKLRHTAGSHRAALRASASDSRIHAVQKDKLGGSRDTHETGTRTSRIHAVRGGPIPREYLFFAHQLLPPSRYFRDCFSWPAPCTPCGAGRRRSCCVARHSALVARQPR